MARRYTLDVGGKTFTIDVEETDADSFAVEVDGERYDVTLAADEDLPVAAVTPAFQPSRPAQGAAAPAGERPAAVVRKAEPASRKAPPARRGGGGSASGGLGAPMPGVVLEVMVKAGDRVTRGQEIAVLEAMKMQNMIRSPRDAVIAEVCVAAGQAVGHGDSIVRFAEG